MSSITIKNCGLNSTEAVEAATVSGADFLGFISYPPSPRHVSAEQIATLTADIPANIARVLVLVNPCNATIEQHLAVWTPTHLQLHEDESPERCAALKAEFGLPIIKALPVANADDIEAARAYESVVDFLLFDTKAPAGEVSGGTGRSFDWSLLTGKTFTVPYFLSGGIASENVAEALRISGATAIDISSGLESSRGVKDPEKIRQFNQTVRKL